MCSHSVADSLSQSILFRGLTIPNRDIFLTDIKPAKRSRNGTPLHPVGKSEKIVQSIVAGEILVRMFKHRLEYNHVVDQWFVYGAKPGVWVGVSEGLILSQLKLLFSELNLLHLTRNIGYLISVKQAIQFDFHIYRDVSPLNPPNTLVLKNCRLVLGKPCDHAPEPRCYTGIPYDYDPEQKCPQFLKFLKEFCSGYEDRINLVRALMRCCIESRTYVQKFVEFVGQGKTGKSTLQSILLGFVGLDNSVVTTLRDLNGNVFESSLLQHKKLIVISDSEYYNGSVSVLKMISGNDLLPGRKKHVQEGFNVLVEGIIVIFGNYALHPKDSSTGFSRRQIFFPATHVVPVGKEGNLIYCTPSGEFTGPISQEFSGILNWVMELDPTKAVLFMTQSRVMVPSLSDTVFRKGGGSNSISCWIEDELVPGEGAFIGGARDVEGPSAFLFPVYHQFCKRNGFVPVSLRVFGQHLVSIIAEHFPDFRDVRTLRRKTGVFIVGVQINPIVYSGEYQKGGESHTGLSLPLVTDIIPENPTPGRSSIQVLPPVPNSETPVPVDLKPVKSEPNQEIPPIDTKKRKGKGLTVPSAIPQKNHPSLRPQLLQQYLKLLEKKNPIKKLLKERAKLVSKEIIHVDNYVHSKVSAGFKKSAANQLSRGLQKFRTNGPVIEKYGMMGNSPRIAPIKYGDSFNSIKSALRKNLLIWSGKELESLQKPHHIIDIDLKSCYIAILLGLYPQYLPTVSKAVQMGLWNFLEQEFHSQGYSFNKTYVKVAVHSSLFRGGNKAMLNGILERRRKDIGLTPAEWRRSDEIDKVKEEAQGIIAHLKHSPVIIELRNISKQLEKEWIGKTIEGPSGHSFTVTDSEFGSDYSSFLQSYEISLIAQTLLEACGKCPNLFVLNHLHDGVTVMVSASTPVDEIKQVLQSELDITTQRLGLLYPQTFEFTDIYIGL